jgi:hypothetical protein
MLVKPTDSAASKMVPANAGPNDRSALLPMADELEARLRLGLGDQNGATSLTGRLPDDRRILMSAAIALAAGNPQEAAQALSGAPAEGATIRSDLEPRAAREHRHQPSLTPRTCPGQLARRALAYSGGTVARGRHRLIGCRDDIRAVQFWRLAAGMLDESRCRLPA